jgi:hypothetical protein
MPDEDNHIDEWKMKSWLKGMDNDEPQYSKLPRNEVRSDEEDPSYASGKLKGVKAKKDETSIFPDLFQKVEEEEPPIDPYQIHPPFTSLMVMLWSRSHAHHAMHVIDVFQSTISLS